MVRVRAAQRARPDVGRARRHLRRRDERLRRRPPRAVRRAAQGGRPLERRPVDAVAHDPVRVVTVSDAADRE